MQKLSLPMLEDILPGGLSFGKNYLVEFQPHSLWFETGLTLCAQALRMGAKVDFHTFTHPPDDIRSSLRKFSLDVKALEEDDRFRIVDSYTIQTGIGEPEVVGKRFSGYTADIKSVNVDDWAKADIKDAGEPVQEGDKQRLHIDDDTSILVQFNGEAKVVSHFRTQTIPFVRRRQMSALHSLLRGVFSDSFYTQFESFCDGIIEFKAEETPQGLIHLMRVRAIRGVPHDSSWRSLRILESGEVTVERSSDARSDTASAGEARRRLAAIMFTDMVGYTALGQRNESLSLALVEEQRSLLRHVIARHHGREVKTIGDAFLVEFTSAVDAVRCAYDAQRAVREFNLALASEKRIHIRVGIHLGEVVEKEGDIMGDAVNVASRIEPLAEDGGVCLTQQVYDHVRNKVDFRLMTMGKKSLKSVSEAIEVYRMEMPWKSEGLGD